MGRLSLSRAWDESRARLGADGKLFATVALAMIALPSAISTIVNPAAGSAGGSAPAGVGLVTLIMSLVALVGQLALIRLALGPSVSVGGAIRHAAGRALPYLGAVILLALMVLLVVGVPMIALLAMLGVDFEGGGEPLPRGAWLPVLLFGAAMLYVATRMLMTSPVASAEEAGPITILKRSWALTRGNFGRLFAFLVLFVIAALVVFAFVAVMVGLLARTLLGELEPMSGSALLLGLAQGLLSAAATTVFSTMLARMYVQLNRGEAAAEVSVPSSGD